MEPPVQAIEPTAKSPEAQLTLARPWPRYWARTLDLLIWTVGIGVAVVLFVPDDTDLMFRFAGPLSDQLIGILVLPLAILVDATCHAFFGNTPGKRLAGIRILNADATPVSALNYLRRNWRIYAAGLGLGIGIVALFTLLSCHAKARKNELQSWDRALDTRAFQIRAGPWRTYVTASLVLSCWILGAAVFLLGIFGGSADQQLNIMAATVNMTSPTMVDSEIRLDGADAGPGLLLQLNYTMVNVLAPETDKEAVNATFQTSVRELVHKLCAAPEMKVFRDTGATLRSRYVDRKGTLLGTIEARASDCVAHPN